MTNDPLTPGPLAKVAGKPDGEAWVLTFERDLPHPPDAVWPLLTVPDELVRWAPYTADRDLSTTGPATLTMIDGEGGHELPATVRQAEEPAVLEHTWGEDLLRWELAATGAGTRLTLSQHVESHEWLAQVAAGWHLCLDVAESVLAGTPMAPIVGAEAMNHGWEALRDAYAEQLATH
jgi:uncharacterized protein YndB with AHSA1/START domain